MQIVGHFTVCRRLGVGSGLRNRGDMPTSRSQKSDAAPSLPVLPDPLVNPAGPTPDRLGSRPGLWSRRSGLRRAGRFLQGNWLEIVGLVLEIIQFVSDRL